jgi:hypothetical protein
MEHVPGSGMDSVCVFTMVGVGPMVGGGSTFACGTGAGAEEKHSQAALIKNISAKNGAYFLTVFGFDIERVLLNKMILILENILPF